VLALSLAVLQSLLPAAPPCADCALWEVTAEQAAELLAKSDALEGLDLLVRVSEGEIDPAGLLLELQARGARAGLIVPGPGEIPAAAAMSRQVVIDPVLGDGDDPDRLAFDIKRMATEIRAGNPGVEIGIETGPEGWEPLDERGVGPYVDWLVGPTSLDGAGRRGGLPVRLRMTPPCPVEGILSLRDHRGQSPDDPMPRPRFSARVEVVAERSLTVAEVVARHQASAARQRRLVRRSISSGTMVVTFQVRGLAAPMTLASDVVHYEGDGLREIEQRSVRLNGAPQGTRAPRLPLLEPERVSAPPLALDRDASYRYRLQGRETIEGSDCYVVAFEPVSRDRTLPRGRAWIDARAFALVRLETAQAGLRAPIVSSEQRDAFKAVALGADDVVWLPWRSEVHQVYEGPGHTTPIDRILQLERLEPNPADFDARRAAAHASSSVMVADTGSDLRYLRHGDGADGAAAPRRAAPGGHSRLRTVAAGVLVDPHISRPLPFAGLGYLDFDFLGTGAQVNGYFGGLFAQFAWTIPAVSGTRWQAQGSGFAALASYNDRAFMGGVERHEENLRQRPARVTAGVARPLGRARLRVDYELDYTRLARTDTTAPEFVVPPSPVVHGLRVAFEARRGPWSAAAWWNGARRQRWAEWGLPGAETTPAGFQRFGASAGRGFVMSPRSAARVDVAWMGGRGLDRFSRYAFDGFLNRLRGYPAAAVRYDRGGVAHGVFTWDAGRGVRLDAFLDAARVRDPGRGPRSRTYVGVGAAVEAPLPAQALAAVEWGYGLQAPAQAGGAGTHVLRVTAYKMF
jgi:hypothetical protein